MAEEIKLKITGESSDAIKDLKKTEDAVDDVTKAVKDNTKAVAENKTESKSMINSLADVKAGYDAIKDVLFKVIEYIGSSIQKFKESGAEMGNLGRVMERTKKEADDLQLAVGKLSTALFNAFTTPTPDAEKTTLGTITSLLNKLSGWVDNDSSRVTKVLGEIFLWANPITATGKLGYTVYGMMAKEIDELTDSVKSFDTAANDSFIFASIPNFDESKFFNPNMRRTVTPLPEPKQEPKRKGKTAAQKAAEAQKELDDLMLGAIEIEAGREDYAREQLAKEQELAEARLEIEKTLQELKIKNHDDEMRMADEAIQKKNELQQAQAGEINSYRQIGEAAISAFETAGLGAKESALLQGLIHQAMAIGAFFNPFLGGPAGAASLQASALALFAAAGKSGGGGSAKKGGSASADVSAQRIQNQKEATMSLKEAFTEALKDSQAKQQNITYVINQSGTYLGNDNTSLLKIRQALDRTDRLRLT